MYCNKCGQTLADGSRFCNVCGAQLPAAGSPDASVGVATYADEHEMFTVRPTMIFVVIRYIIAAVVIIATAALMGVLSRVKPDLLNGTVSFIVILAVAILAFSNPIYKHILRRREVYTLTNHKLEMRYGIISKIVRNIPLKNIQDVTVTASIWQRMMNLGDIEIDSASESGKIILDDIHHPERYANLILSELRRRN